MTNAICEQPETTCRLRRMSEIDRMTEAELEAMTPDDLDEIRRLLLETLEQDLKKTLETIDEN